MKKSRSVAVLGNRNFREPGSLFFVLRVLVALLQVLDASAGSPVRDQAVCRAFQQGWLDIQIRVCVLLAWTGCWHLLFRGTRASSTKSRGHLSCGKLDRYSLSFTSSQIASRSWPADAAAEDVYRCRTSEIGLFWNSEGAGLS